METPHLQSMWETFIKIQDSHDVSIIFEIIRSKISPLLHELLDKNCINWYCFLVHDRKSGNIPSPEGDNSFYFHLRLNLVENVNGEDFMKMLPDYCVMTRKANEENHSLISGIDKSLLKSGQIEDAWRIIGEECELIIKIMEIYIDECEPEKMRLQMAQYLHYLSNITQIRLM